MLTRTIRYLLSGFASSARRLVGRKAAVALIFALMAPLLIAVTGLSVDIGYWYQNQTSLQSAADAAALAAAMSDARINDSTASAKATDTAVIAQTAANQATNSAFNFSSNSSTQNVNPQVSVSCCASTGSSVGTYTGTTQYTATVQAPRQSFLSTVAGLGFKGISSGTQYASATASMAVNSLVTGQSCLFVNPTDGADTGITFVNYNGGGSSNGIQASNCSITVNCGTNGIAFHPPSSANADISAQNITIADANGCTPGYSSNLYTNADATEAKTSGCTSSDSYCGVQTSGSVAGDPLKNMGNALTTAWQAACNAATSFNSSGSTSYDLYNNPSKYSAFSGHQYTYGSTTYTIKPNTVCEPSGSNDFFSGGTYFNTAGTYFFPAGLSYKKGDVTFGPGVYYFGGSLADSGNNTLTSNGATLIFVGNATMNLSGDDPVALVAPDPSLGDSCLTSPTNYPVTTIVKGNNPTLDGTYGGGICGIAIYQARGDTGPMSLGGHNASTVIGIIYAPDSAITFNGNGGFSAGYYSSGSLGTFALMANNITVNGGGNGGGLILNMNTSDSAGSITDATTTTTTTTPPVLIN